MKNRLFYLLLAGLFILGNSAFNALDGGVIADIVLGKNGEVVCSFSIPDKYIDKSGELMTPIEIAISKDGKKPTVIMQSYDLSISLPSNLSGTYLIEVSIGNDHFLQEIQL